MNINLLIDDWSLLSSQLVSQVLMVDTFFYSETRMRPSVTPVSLQKVELDFEL